MINEVILSNFKCYEKEPFKLSNLTVFCGNNSAGKSTVIQALLLAFQNDFSSNLELTGDYIQPGSYDDIHNRNAENDSLEVKLITSRGHVAWGYDDLEFDSKKRIEVEEAPLPLLSRSNEVVNTELYELYKDDFTYLTAERWGPRSNYPYSTKRRSNNWLGVHGEYTPQVLEVIATSIIRFPTQDVRLPPNVDRNTVTSLADVIYEWMGEISPGVFIKAKSHKDADISTNQYRFGGHFYRAVNVGFGLSYVLPVVLALLNAKPGGLVIIENPEAHIHPRGQSYLGRLIALTAQSGVQVIVETHSDHVINGMRIMPRLGLVDCDKITIYQVFSGGEHSKVDKITVDSQGELSEWPKDFFDQQLVDMDILMSGKDV
jgi:predicted ATPase